MERQELEKELKKWKTEMVEEKKEKEQVLFEMRARVDEAKGGKENKQTNEQTNKWTTKNKSYSKWGLE